MPQWNELEEALKRSNVENGSHVADVRQQQPTQVAFLDFEEDNEDNLWSLLESWIWIHPLAKLPLSKMNYGFIGPQDELKYSFNQRMRAISWTCKEDEHRIEVVIVWRRLPGA